MDLSSVYRHCFACCESGGEQRLKAESETKDLKGCPGWPRPYVRTRWKKAIGGISSTVVMLTLRTCTIAFLIERRGDLMNLDRVVHAKKRGREKNAGVWVHMPGWTSRMR
ncbi:hypothetical protein K474DRAFT_524627 [Panus rudis PR-1116 ss-1]|nr:hypothetical protein K474DRAFT_524627 [Panus rudis PR-1116 ss-1]